MDGRVVVMLGVDPASKERGGIASVVDVYQNGGLFSRWPIVYIGTFSSGSASRKIGIAVSALTAYLRLLLGGRVMLVHAQSASRASFWRKTVFIVLAFAARRPTVLHLHGGKFAHFYEHECGVLRRWLIRAVLSRVDRVVVLSSRWQKVIKGIAPAARVVAIANPVTFPAAISTTDEREPGALLFLGRLGQGKGIYDLLEALVVVKKRFPHARLRCAGDGEIERVRSRARALGIEDSVDLLGWIDGSDKERELSRAEIYVLPSYAEGLPMGVLEALAAGVPTVASDVGGIPDAIEDGVDGFLVRPGDVGALADRLIRLLESAELRNEFASAGRRKVLESFSVETVLSQVDDLYKSLGVRPRVMENRSDLPTGVVRTQE